MNKNTSKFFALAIIIGVAVTVNFASALVTKTVNTLNEFYYFDTNQLVGFGTTTPAARVDIAAGTATIPQMHFASSTPPTSPRVGDMYFHDDGLHLKTNFTTMGLSMCDYIATTTVTVSNTTASTTLYTFPMPAGSFAAPSEIRVEIDGAISNASAADDYTLYAYLDGVEMVSIPRVGGNVTDAGWSFKHNGAIRTSGVSGTFIDHIRWTEHTLAGEKGYATPKTFDTTVAHTYSINVVWAAAKAGNTISMLNGRVCVEHQ